MKLLRAALGLLRCDVCGAHVPSRRERGRRDRWVVCESCVRDFYRAHYDPVKEQR